MIAPIIYSTTAINCHVLLPCTFLLQIGKGQVTHLRQPTNMNISTLLLRNFTGFILSFLQ